MSASLYSALHLADRFALMLHHLAGRPLPTLPDAPGRRCRPLGEIPPDDSDPHAAAWDAEHALATVVDSEGGDARQATGGPSPHPLLGQEPHRTARLDRSIATELTE